MTYSEFKKSQSEMINNLPIIWAFSKARLIEKAAEIGATIDDLVSLDAGGYCLKSDVQLINDTMAKAESDLVAFLADDDNLQSALEYELANHEYCITYDETDTIYALNLDIDCDRVRRILAKAKQSYLANCNF